MNQRSFKILLNCFLFATAETLCMTCVAQTSESPAIHSSMETGNPTPPEQDSQAPEQPQPQNPTVDYSNSLGTAFLKNLVADQKAIWTSPAHLHWADGSWLFPFAAVTAGFFATDRAVPPALSTDPTKLNRYTSISNYGLYSMIGAG